MSQDRLCDMAKKLSKCSGAEISGEFREASAEVRVSGASSFDRASLLKSSNPAIALNTNFPNFFFFSLPFPLLLGGWASGDLDTPPPLGQREHAPYATPRTSNLNLDFFALGRTIETPTTLRPEFLPPLETRIETARTHDQTLGMERMRTRALPHTYTFFPHATLFKGGVRLVEVYSLPGGRHERLRGRGERRRGGGGIIVVLRAAHTTQVVASQPDLAFFRLDERAD